MSFIEPRTEYARSGDVHIAYQTVGEGPRDLVLAPGFISHIDLQWSTPAFAAYVRALTDLGRVILFDKRGTGLSDPVPDADRFDRRMDDIRAVMDAAESERAVLIGVSEGGPLISLFAATHPDRVEALVFYGTFARGSAIDRALIKRFRHAIDNWGEGLTADIFVSPGDTGAVVKRFTGLFERASASPGLAGALLDSIETCDVRSALPLITAPTIVVHRHKDPFAKREWSQELADLVPGAALVELPGDAHIPWLGDIDELVGVIEQFVTGKRTPHTGNSAHVTVLGTVLFTDIVDSTRLAVELGDTGWVRLLTEYIAKVRDRITAYRGREIERTGDGFLLIFESPGRAISCALDLAKVARSLGIEIRAGLHTGECRDLGPDGLAGITLHLGARIGSLARPGQVFVSAITKELSIGGGFRFQSIGLHRLKGLPSPVEVFEVLDDNAASSADDIRRRISIVDRLSLGLIRRMPAFVRALARLTGR